MKQEIRRKVFETNSSSVHSLTMCEEEDFEAWKKGEKILWEDGGKIVTMEEYENAFKEAQINDNTLTDKNDFNEWFGYRTYEDYIYDDYFEKFEDKFTSKSGDTIVSFGYYGHD